MSFRELRSKSFFFFSFSQALQASAVYLHLKSDMLPICLCPDFTEMTKALGYPRLISVENFRTPNFELVADVLYWLVHRYDNFSDISNDISTEQNRVDFLKTVAQVFYDKASVKLNIKQLYKADGYAVKELLKICGLLYGAMRVHEHGDQAGVLEENLDINIESKLDELKSSKNLASEIVESGAKLFTLLSGEPDREVARNKGLQFLEGVGQGDEKIERSIRQQTQNIQDNVLDLEKMCAELETEDVSLKQVHLSICLSLIFVRMTCCSHWLVCLLLWSLRFFQKIERKATDLERAEKRLKSLRTVRPAFMDEYDNLQGELRVLYAQYLERFRNVNYLEAELSKYRAQEYEKKLESDRALNRMQKRLHEEELRILRGEDEDKDYDGMGDNHDVYDSGREDSEEEDNDDDDFRQGGGAGSKKDAGGRGGGAKVGRERRDDPDRSLDASDSLGSDLGSDNDSDLSELSDSHGGSQGADDGELIDFVVFLSF